MIRSSIICYINKHLSVTYHYVVICYPSLAYIFPFDPAWNGAYASFLSLVSLRNTESNETENKDNFGRQLDIAKRSRNNNVFSAACLNRIYFGKSDS